MPTGAPPAALLWRPLHLLIIDDSMADLELARAAVEAVDASVRVTTASSWTEFSRSMRTAPPDLILVDAHMPGIDGFAVLQWLKADPVLRGIPVIVRSGSAFPADVTRAYRQRANAYLVKPSGFDELVEQVRSLLGFWQFNRTPSGDDRPASR